MTGPTYSDHEWVTAHVINKVVDLYDDAGWGTYQEGADWLITVIGIEQAL